MMRVLVVVGSRDTYKTRATSGNFLRYDLSFFIVVEVVSMLGGLLALVEPEKRRHKFKSCWTVRVKHDEYVGYINLRTLDSVM